MAKINLLPWREERREELKKEFLVVLGGVAAFAVALVLVWQSITQSHIENQDARNRFLQEKISELKEQVTEINELKSKREQLIERMRVIQQLQGTRPEIVHIFDELVRTIPDGVYYTSIERRGAKISIKGTAESNNRVSSLMRRLDASPWFTDPNLIGVKANPGFGEQANDFELTIILAPPASENADEQKSG